MAIQQYASSSSCISNAFVERVTVVEETIKCMWKCYNAGSNERKRIGGKVEYMSWPCRDATSYGHQIASSSNRGQSATLFDVAFFYYTMR